METAIWVLVLVQVVGLFGLLAKLNEFRDDVKKFQKDVNQQHKLMLKLDEIEGTLQKINITVIESVHQAERHRYE
jgi:hypothetical protein